VESAVQDERIANAETRSREADARIANADADIAKLARIKKEGDRINLEFQMLTQALNDYSNGKITAEQFRSKTSNA
jgi:hypothetical protein